MYFYSNIIGNTIMINLILVRFSGYMGSNGKGLVGPFVRERYHNSKNLSKVIYS